MANPNIKPSQQVALLGFVSPVSQGVGSISTGWVSMAGINAALAVIETGVLGASATLGAKLEQATSDGGAGAKDITDKAITQIVKATGDNKQAMINCRADELDTNNDFTYIRLTLTVGTAASLIAAQLLGFYGRYQPVDHAASMVEAVS